MLSDDVIAEHLRLHVCKIVLALDEADFQPIRFDIIMQSQVRYVDVFRSADSMSMENVFNCFCVNDQCWFHSKTQVTHHALDAFRF